MTLVSRTPEGSGRLQDEVVARWADLLVDYCLKVEPGETIAIGAEILAQPLVEACYKAIVPRGGAPARAAGASGTARVFPARGVRATTRSRSRRRRSSRPSR